MGTTGRKTRATKDPEGTTRVFSLLMWPKSVNPEVSPTTAFRKSMLFHAKHERHHRSSSVHNLSITPSKTETPETISPMKFRNINSKPTFLGRRTPGGSVKTKKKTSSILKLQSLALSSPSLHHLKTFSKKAKILDFTGHEQLQLHKR